MAIDEATSTVVAVGFKNFNTNDATGGSTYPVYVPVLRGFDFAGTPKYVGYNWSSDPLSPSWLNLANNNMADARLNRCAIGKDGKLYIAGQLYGGNHIFRYLPFDNTGLAPLAGGDTYHNLANTGTESHIYFGKFDVATGNVINQQTITARLSSTAGNSMFIEQGGIDADKAGNVYVTGSSAFGMPMSVDYQPGEYTGGAFLMQFNSSLARTNSVRLASDGMGRSVYAKENNQYAYVGTVNNGVIYTTAPHFQPASAGSREGFIGLVNTNNCTISSNQTSLATANYSANNLVATNLFYDAVCKPVVKVVPTNTTATAYFADTAAVKMWIENITTPTFVKRHFEITPVDNSGNIKPDAATKTAKVTLYFTQAEFNEYNNLVTTKLPLSSSDAAGIANLRVEKFAGMSNSTTGLPETYTNGSVIIDPIDNDIIWNATDVRWEVSFDVTGFSGFFVKAPQGTLPLTLLSFTGKRNGLNNDLSWVTENEISVKNYTIEKSIDAINFKAKATVAALNILQKHQYDYTDVNATDNISYYRLKITNQNNSTSYSNIIKLTNAKIDFSIFPNPTTSSITFNSKQKQTVLVTDVMGRKIKTILLAEGVTNLLLEDLKPGIYFIKDAFGNTKKLIKQ